MQVQSTGMVPSVSIDKTDGIQVYVTREALAEMMFSTSKSADMNIVTPGARPDDDYIEIPIPHQYVHRVVNGKITCSPSDLYSH
jgi:adenylyl cyclase-associated protein